MGSLLFYHKKTIDDIWLSKDRHLVTVRAQVEFEQTVQEIAYFKPTISNIEIIKNFYSATRWNPVNYDSWETSLKIN